MKNLNRVFCSVLSSTVLLGSTRVSVQAGDTGQAAISGNFSGDLRSGDVGRISAALKAGASANARDINGNTALMWAAVYGDLDCVKLWVEKGAEINATNALGATALMRAAFDSQKVRLLVERGAEVNW